MFDIDTIDPLSDPKPDMSALELIRSLDWLTFSPFFEDKLTFYCAMFCEFFLCMHASLIYRSY